MNRFGLVSNLAQFVRQGTYKADKPSLLFEPAPGIMTNLDFREYKKYIKLYFRLNTYERVFIN